MANPTAATLLFVAERMTKTGTDICHMNMSGCLKMNFTTCCMISPMISKRNMRVRRSIENDEVGYNSTVIIHACNTYGHGLHY
jgi:hypothetical protein